MFVTKEKSLFKILILLILCATATMVLQAWVGELTIYNEKLREKRALMHKAMINNELPEGKTWGDYGANGINRRIFVVYLAEYVHRLSGLSLCHVYKAFDYIFLFLCFPCIFFYLRNWVDEEYCLIGILYTAVVFVMTYHFHYFHPWDRISLLSWILLIYLIRERRTVLFAVLLAFFVTIKYDVKVAPFLYFLYNYSKLDRRKTIFITILLFFISFGMDELLMLLFPMVDVQYPFTESIISIKNQIAINYRHFKQLHFAYPPLLMFLIPCLLAPAYWDKKDKFTKSSVLFAFLLFIPHSLFANFREVRAETMILVLLLPSALLSLKKLLRGEKKVHTSEDLISEQGQR